MHGLPKHLPGFSHLPYVNPDAPRGGRLVLGQQGTFDSLNPFVVKGRAAAALRNYVYESLLARSGDEPFTLYGLIAESIEVPPDRSSAIFHLRPEARFADGQPVTPDDVLFSHAFLKDKGYPFYREHYRKVSAIEKIGDRSVRFTFNAAGDREIPLILGLMPILPRHKFDGEPTLEPPGSENGWSRDAPARGRRAMSLRSISCSTASSHATQRTPSTSTASAGSNRSPVATSTERCCTCRQRMRTVTWRSDERASSQAYFAL